ncbi:MAG: glucokinase [Candidatus Promineifilaceae bacterium]
MSTLLAGDIGGTKTVLALFSSEQGPHQPLIETRYDSPNYDSLTSIVDTFARENELRPEAVCLGVAGPVARNRVQVTNLPWDIDGAELSRILGGIPVRLINDLEAIASAVPTLTAADLAEIKSGARDEHGPIAVLAPGTGLGEAFLFWDGRGYRPIPSEGGHTDYGPDTPLELDLLSYLQPKLGHVSYERVCSGIGIPNLYAFFRDTGRYPEPEWLAEQLAAAEDKTPVIFNVAQQKRAAICEATVELFLSILGSEAGNLVLQVLARGGVFLGGGIPPRIVPELRGRTFLEAFTRKGRFAKMLLEVPVYVIVNPKAGLYGAANHGLSLDSLL